ncbi:MAG: reverse transcriptase/maturase family protein [Lentisphaeria bacterium]|nr:reverse transcriptase/maturase family protein [Lentisphaeria bacterium]
MESMESAGSVLSIPSILSIPSKKHPSRSRHEIPHVHLFDRRRRRAGRAERQGSAREGDFAVKSFGGIWDRLLRMETFLEAFHLAAKGKGAIAEVVEFRRDLHANLRRVIDAIGAGEYRFGPYRSFMVYDPKPRLIQVASFEQRVIHQAIIQACGPVFERTLIHDSYACRKGKGQHRAVLRARHFTRRGPWYLKMDIRKFYDSASHDVLLRLVAKRFRERALNDLFARLVESYQTAPGRGLPIGNLTSQYFGNFLLDGFDHWITEEKRAPGYIRYMDDMLVFGTSAAVLRGLRDAANAPGMTACPASVYRRSPPSATAANSRHSNACSAPGDWPKTTCRPGRGR